jgi:anti-sigma-K factor RskA
MAFDLDNALAHADVAGWVLGALDPADARTFEEHLRSCEQCQAAVAELEPVAKALGKAAPAVEPPEDLEARTVAAVQYAVMAASRPEPEKAAAKASRWWHLHVSKRFLPLLSAVAAAAVTAAAFVGVQLSGLTAPPLAATISLHAVPGQTGSGNAAARHADGGWAIQLTVRYLPKLGPGQFYECWYVGPNNRPGHPELITAGTFVSSNVTLHMWSAADPAKFKIMQITIEQPGGASQRGPVILQGAAKPV